ncbi:hypothetical protein ACSMAF_001136 [Cronobacter universalis]
MLSSIKEALSSAVTTASQRVRNPVFGAFVLSWCAFNWKQILYLFFSDKGIYNKIEYISANSNWSFNLILPVVSALAICIVMPWANNIISWLQTRPLDNNDSIENQRKAKQILRSTRLRRLEAKRDVTYEKVKTGDEINIQKMKEQITQSQERMGEITAEKESALRDFIELSKQFELLKELADKHKYDAAKYKSLSEKQQGQIENLSEQLNSLSEINKVRSDNHRSVYAQPGAALNRIKIGAGLVDKD